MFKDNKKFVAESIFIKEALKQGLSLNEFLLLLYFDNSFDPIFNIKVISKALSLSEEKILEAYSNLMSKKIIKVKAEKDDEGKIVERVSLEKFYNEIKSDNKKQELESDRKDIFSIFESEFGKTLSAMDYEIINAWIDKGFSEEIIVAALKEAVYNGVCSLRYIDKVLYEWNKKGYKTIEQVNNRFNDEQKDENKLFETSILNFDWLNEK
ncbi:MAG: DnaD domain-containing protein [Bacilli bacterium]